VKLFCRVATLLFVWSSCEPLQKRFERVTVPLVRPLRIGIARFVRRHQVGAREAPVIRLIDDVSDEAISMTRNRPDISGIPRIVSERSPQRADGLAQCAVGHDHVRPYPIEDVAPVDGLAAMLDQKQQQVEIAWDQRDFAAAPGQDALAWRQEELTEPITLQRRNDTRT
jgi:hypothetical protein